MEERNLSLLLCAGFPQREFEEAMKIFEKYPPGMFILFKDNIKTKEEVKELCKTLKKMKSKPLISIDMEGGRVNRLKDIFGEKPSAEEYGRYGVKRIEKMAYEWGMEMKSLYIDIDFAPLLDLGPIEKGTGLERRVLSEDLKEVIKKGKAFLKGLHRAKILGCIKHFPGLGPSKVDSHINLPLVELEKKELKKHLFPFIFLKKYSPLVMVAHCLYKNLDKRYPASLSKKIINKLRPYKGLIISDDLEMGALSSYGNLSKRTYLSLKAGCGMVILSHRFYEIPFLVKNLKFKGKIKEYLLWKRRVEKNVEGTFTARY